MSKVTLEVVVAPSFLEKAGVKPGDPLQEAHRRTEGRDNRRRRRRRVPRKRRRAGWRPKAASIRKPTSRSRRSAARSRCRRRWKTSASTRSCCRRRKATSRPNREPAPSWFRWATNFRCSPISLIWCWLPRSRSTTRRRSCIVKTARAMQAASAALVANPEPAALGDPETILCQGRSGGHRRRGQGA